jgi:hypothetical protein
MKITSYQFIIAAILTAAIPSYSHAISPLEWESGFDRTKEKIESLFGININLKCEEECSNKYTHEQRDYELIYRDFTPETPNNEFNEYVLQTNVYNNNLIRLGGYKNYNNKNDCIKKASAIARYLTDKYKTNYSTTVAERKSYMSHYSYVIYEDILGKSNFDLVNQSNYIGVKCSKKNRLSVHIENTNERNLAEAMHDKYVPEISTKGL